MRYVIAKYAGSSWPHWWANNPALGVCVTYSVFSTFSGRSVGVKRVYEEHERELAKADLQAIQKFNPTADYAICPVIEPGDAAPTTITVFHGTDRRFDAFSNEALGSREDRSENGYLGVWCATELELASRFGEIVLTVEVAVKQMYAVPIDIVSKWNQKAQQADDAKAYYTELRNEFLAQGTNILRILELSGNCDMVILLDAPESATILPVATV